MFKHLYRLKYFFQKKKIIPILSLICHVSKFSEQEHNKLNTLAMGDFCGSLTPASSFSTKAPTSSKGNLNQ